MKNYRTNFILASIFIFALLGCSSESQSQSNQNASYKNINQSEFQKIAQKPDAVIVDVRTPEEISAGYIPGASVFADINNNDFKQKINALDKSKTYVVYCRSGARSSNVANYMVQNGFTHVYNLNGGILIWKGDLTKP